MHNIFFYSSQPKHMLSPSPLDGSFGNPKHMYKMVSKKIFTSLGLKPLLILIYGEWVIISYLGNTAAEYFPRVSTTPSE